jgi:hypothetical protein
MRFVLQAHLCTVWEKGQYRRTREIEKVKASFEDLLMRLGTQRVDIGMITMWIRWMIGRRFVTAR